MGARRPRRKTLTIFLATTSCGFYEAAIDRVNAEHGALDQCVCDREFRGTAEVRRFCEVQIHKVKVSPVVWPASP